MALTQIDDRGLKTPIDLIDNEKIRLGTGNDLEIYHDGTNNQIKCAVDNQDITITSTKDLYLKTGDGSTGTHTFLYAADNAGVELRYDNVKKLETSAGGVSITGELAVTSDVHFNSATNAGKDVYWDESASELQFSNDVKAKFGDGLEISHSGSNDASYIKESGTSNLYIYSENLRMMSADGSEAYIEANNDGAVELYHNNLKKFETTSTGIQVTDSDTSVVVKLETSSGTAGYLYGASNTECGILDAQGHNAVLVTKDAATELYYDNSKKLATTSGGVHIYNALNTSGAIGIGNGANLTLEDNGEAIFGLGSDLKIYHDGSNTYLDNTTGDVYLRQNGTENSAKFIKNGAVELYYNDDKKFETTNTGFGGLGMLNAGPTSNNGYTYHDIRNSTDDQWLAALRHTTGTSPYGIWMGYTDASPDQNGNEFCRFDDSTAQRFRVNSDGDIYTHDSGNINSDRTMKENIVDASPKLDDLMKLKVRNFTWKKEFHPAKEGQKKIGFIAQEVEEVFPKLVTESNVAPLGKPDVIKKEIKQAWAPILVKALQEAVTKIETLETKVAALEAA